MSKGRCSLLGLFAGCLLIFPEAYSRSVYDALKSAAGADADALGFKNALALSGLQSMFSNTTWNVTVLAPTDAALSAALPLLGVSWENFVQNAPLMQRVLLYHVFTPAMNLSAFAAGATTKSTLAPGPLLNITKIGSSINVRGFGSDSAVVSGDIEAGTSVVHVIDTVLFPFYPTILNALTRNAALSTLATVSSIPGPKFTTGLNDPFLAYTVLAPINSAFTAFYAGRNTSLAQLATTPGATQQLLSYHILPTAALYAANISTTPLTLRTLTGQNVTLVKVGSSVVIVSPSGNATVVVADIQASFTNEGTCRSIIHVIDKVLVPPPFSSATDALTANGVSTLMTAISAEGSYGSALNASTFRGTIFAPSDAAFATALSASQINLTQLVQNLGNLRKILDLHVVPNITLTVAALVDGQQITTFSGANTLTVDKSVAGVTRLKSANNTANITVMEIPINNNQAVVIIIDTVLLPANVSLAVSTTGGSPSPGAAYSIVPSLAMLLWSALSALLLYAFNAQ